MSEQSTTEKRKKGVKTGFRMDQLLAEERQKLVGAFSWLFREDKKQNPAFYQNNK